MAKSPIKTNTNGNNPKPVKQPAKPPTGNTGTRDGSGGQIIIKKK